MNNGDIVVYETDELEWILIFEDWYKPYDGHIHYYALLVYPDKLYLPGTCCILDEDCFREPTDEEKQLLFDKLEENGYKWDGENKKLIKI